MPKTTPLNQRRAKKAESASKILKTPQPKRAKNPARKVK
jgi:hypothetical protein